LEQKAALQRLRIIVAAQHFPDSGQGKPHVPESPDAVGRGELALAVIPVSGKRVNGRRGQKARLVIAAQRADADSGEFGKFADFQHRENLHNVVKLELRYRISPPPGESQGVNYKNPSIYFHPCKYGIHSSKHAYKEAVESKKNFFRKVKERLDKTG
jgi:hypothetical protein